MTLQAGQRSESTTLTVHQFGLANCPACGQEIPPDKFEEISGKIAVRERERTLAITTQLEKQYALEKTAADAKAKADLESERQQSTAREARVRQGAQRAAEKLIGEKMEESQRDRQKLVDGWRQQVEEAESKQHSAEQVGANLRAEIQELRQSTAAALEVAASQAEQRETEIRDEATRNAESAAAERIQAIEAAQRESEATLQAKINDAEANRIAAEQNQTELRLQIEKLREVNEAEVARMKEEAATEAVRIHQVATEKAELRHRDTLAAQEKAVAEANAKALEAERHASEIEENLRTQREIMEQERKMRSMPRKQRPLRKIKSSQVR